MDKKMEIINNIKPGVCVRFGFISQVPVKAAFKDDFQIRKFVVTTGRTGVRYNKLKAVLERKEESPAKRNTTNNYTWVIPQKVKFNSNTQKNYLVIATLPHGHNSKVAFEVRQGDKYCYFHGKKEFMESEFAQYVQPSYFKKSSGTEVMSVNLDNVFCINKEYFLLEG